MKKFYKAIIPTLACVTLLAGCSNAPKLKDKKETVTSENGDTYQKLFENLYNTSGVDTAVKELLVEVADYVLDNSSFWADKKDAEIEKRIKEQFNDFYSASFKKDGLFDEEILVAHILEDHGFNLELQAGKEEGYKEDGDDLLGNKDLLDVLCYDYSEYKADLAKSIKLDLLKEEYVRTQKGTNSDGSINSTYFEGKKFRKVEYFTFSPETKDRLEYTELFTEKVNEVINSGSVEFEDFAFDTLSFEWKVKQLDDLAKDFALINEIASPVGHDPVSVNDRYGDLEIPSEYREFVKASEFKWATDEKYGFKNINSDDLVDEVKTKVTDKYNTYSNNGAQSIYKGYYLKQLEILTTNFYTDMTYCTETTSVISTQVTNAIKSTTSDFKYEIGEGDEKKTSNFIDANQTGSVVYKNGDSCYIIYSENFGDFSFTENTQNVIDACRQLAKTSSNVKNCWYYYLTELDNSGEFSVNWQDIYDSLNETYSFGEKD